VDKEVNIIMKTLSLSAVIFLVISLCFVNSTTSILNRAVGEYDPWYDFDEDGDIDIYDIVDIAGRYDTTGDYLKHISLENWLPPQPKTLLYYSWPIWWTEGSQSGGTVPPPLYVGNYSRMSVLLELDNINVDYGQALWTAQLEWISTPDNSHDTYNFLWLGSTLVWIHETGAAKQISIGSYAIEAPYVQFMPRMVNLGDETKGNATLTLYLFLSQSSCAEQTRAASWETSRYTNNPSELFGPYRIGGFGCSLGGFSKITVELYTNVTCEVEVADKIGLIDSYSKGSGWESRVYELTSTRLSFFINTYSSAPWYAVIAFRLFN
jgi:hypothetical protein